MSVKSSSAPKIWKLIAAFGFIIGLLLVSLGLYYLLLYFVESSNAYRHEYLSGTALAIMFSIPLWLLASFSMYKMGDAVPKTLYVFTIATSIAVCLFFLASLVAPLMLS